MSGVNVRAVLGAICRLLLADQAETDAERAAAIADTGPQGYARELREPRLAVGVEKEMSKEDILEGYLNIANFGGPSGHANYGIESAARYYFSTSTSELTLPQAALLAGLVQRPTGYQPERNPEAAIGRRDTVITRMEELGMIDRGEAADARQADLGLEIDETRNGCVPTAAPWICDCAVREILEMEKLGDTPEERMQLLSRGRLEIATTLDIDVHRATQDAASARVAATDDAVGTMVVVEPGTGEIKSLANSREYGPDGEGRSMINYATSKAMGNSNGIQAGSAFKPFVLAAALGQGLSSDHESDSPPEIDMSGEWFETCWNDQTRVRDNDYEPRNSTPGGDGLDMRQATEWSTNTYFVQLLQETGICDPARIAERSGVWKQVPDSAEPQPLEQVPSFVLGPNILSTDVAGDLNDLLQGVIDNDGATGTAMQLAGGRPAAGKTGTTDDNVAVWFVGYTPQLSAAAAVADLEAPQSSLSERRYNGQYMPEAVGGNLPAPMWRNAMDDALDGEPHEEFG